VSWQSPENANQTTVFPKIPVEVASRVHWKIGLLLSFAALVAFFQRVSISVAGDSIMREFQLSQTRMGTVFSAFVLGYTLFQVPGGMLADRWGTKRVLGWAMISWSLFTFLTGLIGKISLLTGLGVVNALITLRFVFGIFQAPLFPASTRLVANWFPTRQRGSGNALALTGISVGSLLMPPIVSWIVLTWSWQGSFYMAALLSLLVAVVWSFYVRDHPSQHRAVNQAELDLIERGRPLNPDSTLDSPSLLSRLGSGDLWRLVASYTLQGYVGYVFIFWFYLYLVQVRRFGQAEGAWLTTMPWILASITTLGGGYLSDQLIKGRLGTDWGRRIVPMGCQIGAGLLIVAGARVANGYLAAVILAVCTALVLGAEGAYWASANQISGENAGFTGGLMNTGGNLGGVISPTLTPLIAEYFGWARALDFAAITAVGAAFLWLWISPSKQVKGKRIPAPSIQEATEPTSI
jgi:MFS transporter, ACS family, glucarate transporter